MKMHAVDVTKCVSVTVTTTGHRRMALGCWLIRAACWAARTICGMDAVHVAIAKKDPQ